LGKNGGVLHPNGLYIIERSHGPAHIIIRAGIGDVEVLSVQHHVRHTAVGLVHADDVTSPGKGLFAYLEFLV
jgi:hypothetical protein